MKLYNAMEESYLKENLIHKWVTNIVRQNDGYEFLLDDEVYLPVYKYALKITKRKTVKLNLVEEKVLQIVSIGVHQVDEIAKILGITRPLLDVTLADLHVKDLISVSSDICSLLKKGEQALSNLERVEKQQDIMKDIYMDSFKGKILENITRYQVVEKGIIDDNKLEPPADGHPQGAGLLQRQARGVRQQDQGHHPHGLRLPPREQPHRTRHAPLRRQSWRKRQSRHAVIDIPPFNGIVITCALLKRMDRARSSAG